MKKQIISIAGELASGKGVISKAITEKLNYCVDFIIKINYNYFKDVKIMNNVVEIFANI